MTTPVSAILFDLGGVVCRFRPQRRLEALAARCGLPQVEVRSRLWASGFSRDCDAGKYDRLAMYRSACERIGLDASYEEFRSLWSLAFEPDAEVLEVVDRTRPGPKKTLLTDNPPVLLDAMPRLFPEVTRRFDPLLFSCEFGALKPSGELFGRVAARLGGPPTSMVVVDDSPAVVDGARRFGFQTIEFSSPGRLMRDLRRLDLL